LLLTENRRLFYSRTFPEFSKTFRKEKQGKFLKTVITLKEDP